MVIFCICVDFLLVVHSNPLAPHDVEGVSVDRSRVGVAHEMTFALEGGADQIPVGRVTSLNLIIWIRIELR